MAYIITKAVVEERLARVNAMKPEGFRLGIDREERSPLILNADASGYRIDLSNGSHISERATGRQTYAFLEGMAAALWAAEDLMIPSVWP